MVDEAHDVATAMKGNVPPGSELLYRVEEDPETRRSVKTPFLIKKTHAADRRLSHRSQGGDRFPVQ